MLIEPEDIPSKVFQIALALLLTLSLYLSIQNAITATFCNSDACPVRFDFVVFLATLVLTGCAGLGIASIAHELSKRMVKAKWPKTKF